MKAILHVDRNWGIGRGNSLMFRLPLDMKFFRSTTLNRVVVMGSNTLLSFPDGKPLKKRTNIVLWPDGDRTRAERDGFILVQSLSGLFSAIREFPPEDVFIIGGAMMYRTMLPYCSEVLVTKVDADGKAEVFFENLDENPSWRLEEEGEKIIDNGYTVRFCRYLNMSPEQMP